MPNCKACGASQRSKFQNDKYIAAEIERGVEIEKKLLQNDLGFDVKRKLYKLEAMEKKREQLAEKLGFDLFDYSLDSQVEAIRLVHQIGNKKSLGDLKQNLEHMKTICDEFLPKVEQATKRASK